MMNDEGSVFRMFAGELHQLLCRVAVMVPFATGTLYHIDFSGNPAQERTIYCNDMLIGISQLVFL